MVVVLVFLMWAGSATSSSNSSNETKDEPSSSTRSGKSLAFYSPYLEDPQVVLNNVANEFSDYGNQLEYNNRENEVVSSRGRPVRTKQDSPVYYIRLPPSPYMLVPGMGYVSRPPQLRPPPVVQPRPQSQIFNLPLNYVSNAKPTNVYTWKQDSPITTLDKGPYVFNGRPNELFLLRNPYNALYDNTIQNFYP